MLRGEATVELTSLRAHYPPCTSVLSAFCILSHLILVRTCEAATVVIPILQMRKVRLRKVKNLLRTGRAGT